MSYAAGAGGGCRLDNGNLRGVWQGRGTSREIGDRGMRRLRRHLRRPIHHLVRDSAGNGGSGIAVDVGSIFVEKWSYPRIGGKRKEENIQEVHVKVEVEVSIRDVLIILHVPNIPNTAIKCLANFPKNSCEGLELATGTTSMLTRYTMHEDESETNEMSHGFEEGWTILEALVGNEEVLTLLDIGHFP